MELVICVGNASHPGLVEALPANSALDSPKLFDSSSKGSMSVDEND